MPGIVIKDVSDEIHERLKRRAEEHHRSLTKEVLSILEAAVSEPAGPPTLEEIDRLRVRGAEPLTQEMLDEAITSGRR